LRGRSKDALEYCTWFRFKDSKNKPTCLTSHKPMVRFFDFLRNWLLKI
jgi:hypothetical protein